MLEGQGYRAFADLLNARITALRKNVSQFERECGYNIRNWVSHPYTLPRPSRFTQIALDFQVSEEDLKGAYDVAKAYQIADALARGLKVKGHSHKSKRNSCVDLEAHSSIAGQRSLWRTNSQVTNGRFGRQ